MHDFKVPPTIAFGDGSVVIRRSGNSQALVANALGSATDSTGKKTVWLDRLVHRPGEKSFSEGNVVWQVSGAISSVLTCTMS